MALKGVNTGFVPTMGAFHDGHLALMRKAKEREGHCTVSLFVNPTQFGQNEDLSKYPRQEEADFAGAKTAGVDVIFAPSAAEIYRNSDFSIDPGPIARVFEGAQRPNHFAGVSLVVLKLFNIVRPSLAVFGLKDLQQCAVIKKMVDEFNLPLELEFLETQRDHDGLALSSRNAYLSPQNRDKARLFPETLSVAARDIFNGKSVTKSLLRAQEDLAAGGMPSDYCVLIDQDTFQELEAPADRARVMAAVRFQGIRLLDNMPIDPEYLQKQFSKG